MTLWSKGYFRYQMSGIRATASLRKRGADPGATTFDYFASHGSMRSKWGEIFKSFMVTRIGTAVAGMAQWTDRSIWKQDITSNTISIRLYLPCPDWSNSDHFPKSPCRRSFSFNKIEMNFDFWFRFCYVINKTSNRTNPARASKAFTLLSNLSMLSYGLRFLRGGWVFHGLHHWVYFHYIGIIQQKDQLPVFVPGM